MAKATVYVKDRGNPDQVAGAETVSVHEGVLTIFGVSSLTLYVIPVAQLERIIWDRSTQ